MDSQAASHDPAAAAKVQATLAEIGTLPASPK